MPGPWSRTESSPAASATSTPAPGGLHLTALSTRLATSRARRSADRAHHPGLQAAWVSSTRGASRRARSRPAATKLVQAHLLGIAGGLPPPGDVDHVPDQARELVGLGHQIAEQVGPVGVRERVAALEHLDVGAQAGERRAQLVRCVGHELALRLHRALERVEGGVERARQPPQLVVPLAVEAAPWVPGSGDGHGALGEARDRAQGPSEMTQPSRAPIATPAPLTARSTARSRSSEGVDLAQRAGDLDRRAGPSGAVSTRRWLPETSSSEKYVPCSPSATSPARASGSSSIPPWAGWVRAPSAATYWT